MTLPPIPRRSRSAKWIWLAILGTLAIAVFASLIPTPHRMTGEEFERKDRERFKDFYAQKDAKEKEEAAKVSAAREVRIKAFMKSNPSWTRHEAERHIDVEDYDYRAAAEQEGSTRNIKAGCAIVHLELDVKPIGRLSMNEMRQMKACDALGLYAQAESWRPMKLRWRKSTGGLERRHK